MGAFKDLVELCEKLDASIKDRKQRELFLPIKELVFEVKQEQFELETKHVQAIAEMKQLHALEIEKRDSQLANLQAKDCSPPAEFSPVTGTYSDSATGLHYCPKCWVEKKFSPMQDTGSGWKCHFCTTVCSDPARPKKSVKLSDLRKQAR